MNEIARSAIIDVIQKEFEFLNFSDLDPDSPIGEKIDLDSMQLIGLIGRLENEFKIEIPISALDIETLNQFIEIVEQQFTVQ